MKGGGSRGWRGKRVCVCVCVMEVGNEDSTGSHGPL